MSPLSMFAAAGVWCAAPLTGYLVFARTQRAAPDSVPRVTSFALMTVAGLAVWSVPLLAAAVAGVYRGDVLGVAGWAVSIVAAAILLRRGKPLPAASGAATEAPKKKGKGPAPAPAQAPAQRSLDGALWNGVLATGLILAAALYLAFPGESIYGGRDEGVYSSLAVRLARHGQLQVPYPFSPDLAPIFADAFIGFPGYYKTQPLMNPQFGHLLPVWLAQAFATLGQHGLFGLNAVFAVLSLAVFYGLCRMAVAPPYAVVATLFLALNPSQVWIARMTLAEVLTQLFTWSGLLLLLQALRDGTRAPARWAGVFIGLSSFVRFDGLLLVPMLFVAHAAANILRADDAPHTAASKVWLALYQTALPVSLLAFMYYPLVSSAYFEDLRKFYVDQLGAAVAASLLILLLSYVPATRRLRPALTSTLALGAVGVGLFAVAVYAYWLRPHPGTATKLRFQWPGYYIDDARAYSQDSLVNLARYISLPVIFAGIAGWVVSLWTLARRGLGTYLLPALVVIAGSSLLYLWDPGIFPDHLWAVRRFVPVVIPGFVFFAALGAAEALSRLPRQWAVAAAALALVFLSVFTVNAGRLVFTLAEDRGYFTQLQQLANALPPDEPIVARGFTEWLTPLYIAFDRNVVPVNLDITKGRTALERWAAQRAGEHKPTYLLVEGNANLGSVKTVELGKFVITRTYSEPTVNPLPQKTVTKERHLRLLRIDS